MEINVGRKRILWRMFGFHRPTRRQMRELKRIFGGPVEVVLVAKEIGSAKDIAREFREGGYDDIVLVGQPGLLERLVYLGVQPIRAIMVECGENETADYLVKGREGRVTKRLRFSHFERFKGVNATVL